MKVTNVEYEPHAGTHIEHACAEATKLAVAGNRNVTFKFNDITLTATPQTQPSVLSAEFSRICDEQRNAYLNSSEGKAAAERDRLEIAAAQVNIDILLNKLDDVLKAKPLDGLMNWLKEFADKADRVGTSFDYTNTIRQFKDAGFKENEGVGQKPEWFKTRDRMGRYIAGQAINCLVKGMPPHPITRKFVNDYFALPA